MNIHGEPQRNMRFFCLKSIVFYFQENGNISLFLDPMRQKIPDNDDFEKRLWSIDKLKQL